MVDRTVLPPQLIHFRLSFLMGSRKSLRFVSAPDRVVEGATLREMAVLVEICVTQVLLL
jgi:hypothetical protein